MSLDKVHITAGETTELALELSRGLAAAGVVVDEEGAPLADVPVVVVSGGRCGVLAGAGHEGSDGDRGGRCAFV